MTVQSLGALRVAVRLLLSATVITASNLAHAQIPAPELDALKPLMCGSCVLLSDIKAYPPKIFADVLQPGQYSKATVSTPANLSDIKEPAWHGKLRFAIADPAKRASTRHVCLGSRVATPPRTVGVEKPDPNLIQIQDHPDGIDGVCVGELRSIETFLQGIVSGIFAAQLASAEKRTSPEAVNEAIRSNLADVLADHKVQLVQQVKREVVAELRPKSGSPAAPEPAASSPSCTTGTTSCEGKPYTACCLCAGSSGSPNRKGICDASGNKESWRLR